ncbi:unnamed protein product [Leptidea sinapis]|uniref:Uncharacterized protein n=1 Tax=Leptidea sinapis TaxID=189913 RepID=A0A5E4QXI6_9NEOP|nr:unnamed protein product [Leptidea sinapis]
MSRDPADSHGFGICVKGGKDADAEIMSATDHGCENSWSPGEPCLLLLDGQIRKTSVTSAATTSTIL